MPAFAGMTVLAYFSESATAPFKGEFYWCPIREVRNNTFLIFQRTFNSTNYRINRSVYSGNSTLNNRCPGPIVTDFSTYPEAVAVGKAAVTVIG